jgi:hypothetical protein
MYMQDIVRVRISIQHNVYYVAAFNNANYVLLIAIQEAIVLCLVGKD